MLCFDNQFLVMKIMVLFIVAVNANMPFSKQPSFLFLE